MLKEVENLKSNGVFEAVALEKPDMRCVVEERPLQPVIFGQETMLEMAWNRVMDNETAIMGVYGCHLGCGVYGSRRFKMISLINDIWRKVNLTEIGVPSPTRENGCKVVFTTRSREVCGRMGVDDPMEVQCLTNNEAWHLFEKTKKSVSCEPVLGYVRLPEEMSWLVSLKYLDLSRTMISQLPVCLRKLKKLMHLYLEGMRNLRSIDGISSLSSLRTLALLHCNKLRFDESWKELLLLKHSEVLTIEIVSKLVLEKLFFSPMGRRCIGNVVIKDIREESFGFLNFPTILRNLKGQSFPNLSSVSIEGFRVSMI
ncbi:hypothetical protein Bca52824_082278 [Brassica carinata]|uniref:Disease resistance protein n=1 Tax=Brassica carinata TaxID=52824 RepID=A0A8X7PJL8_BRACI|nr:hypothetical protein Bca52824_082278 [Brassica carinata]